MSFLRSYIFAALLSLLVLTGYGYEVFADCCADKAEQTHHAKTDSPKSSPRGADGCQCLCHQAVSHIGAEPVNVAAAALLPIAFTPNGDEFPPDTVPLGIDHPPQLA